MGQIRSIAYQPQNTRGVPDSNESTVLGAPDSVRERVFDSAGHPELFGVTFHEFNELGVGQIYNNLFATYATGTYIGNGGAGSGTFNSATEQVVVGLNLDWFNLISLTQTDEAGAEWALSADDQFPLRDGRVGWYGNQNRGFVSVDNRGQLAIIY